MPLERHIKEEKRFVASVATLVKAYEEIAVIQMQRVRSQVLSAREFVDLINSVFSDVKDSYRHEIKRIEEEKKQQEKPVTRAGVFISAEARLYGDIIGRIFASFKEDYKKRFDNIIIIGKVGRDLMETSLPGVPYEYAGIYDEEKGEAEEIKKLFDLIHEYDEVVVYYGKFMNVINQESVSTVITGTIENGSETNEKIAFFFEPTLADVLSYFENQVVSALMLQTLQEANLARLASRTQAMERARSKIDEVDQKLVTRLHHARRLKDDKKQQERLSGMMLWR